jgi:hypothetical protein
MQDVTNPVNLSFLLSVEYSPQWLPFKHFFISQIIGTTVLLHPSPAPHPETFQLFLICFGSIQFSPSYKAILQI